MITDVRPAIRQDVLRAAIRQLGYVPLMESYFEQDGKSLPAHLSFVCPRCGLELELKNKRELTSIDEYSNASGDKWGWDIENGKKYYWSHFTRCSACRSILEITYDKGRNFISVYREVEKDEV